MCVYVCVCVCMYMFQAFLKTAIQIIDKKMVGMMIYLIS